MRRRIWGPAAEEGRCGLSSVKEGIIVRLSLELVRRLVSISYNCELWDGEQGSFGNPTGINLTN